MPTMIDENRLCSPLHDTYTRLTGQVVALSLQRIFAWNAWMQKGWNAQDLEMVVKLLKQRIKDGKKWPTCLYFRNLIESHDDFEEVLSEARALARIPKVNAERASVLQSTGRSAKPAPVEAKSAGEIMSAAESLKQLLALRDSL